MSSKSLLREMRMLEPFIILPSQVLDLLRRRTLDGEKRLCLAVLTDALVCFQRYLSATDPRERRQYQEAEAWIMAQDRRWPFSFENVCDALGLDPAYLRTGLRRWREEGLWQSGR
jgi:hypothetical protein